MPGEKVLIVEDEAIVARDIQFFLNSQGFDVSGICETGEDAIEKAREKKPDLVLMDIMLKGKMDGIEAARYIYSELKIPIIYLTAFEDKKTLERARQTGPFGYLLKPFEERELYTSIEMALFKSKIERDLRDREEWLFTTLKSIGDAVVVTDQQGIITFINPAAERMTGWSYSNAVGKKQEEVCILSEENNTKSVDPVKTSSNHRGKNEIIIENKYMLSRDGARIPVDESAAPVLDSKGNLSGVVLVFRDISERKKQEEELKNSEEKFRVMAETIESSIFIFNDKSFIYVNPAAERLTEYSKEELFKMEFWKVVHPDFRDMIKERGLLRLQGIDEIDRYETMIITKSGIEKWIYLGAARIQYESSLVVLVSAFDISRLKAIEEELSEEKEKLSITLRSIIDGVIAINNEGLVALMNSAAESITQWKEEDALGKSLEEVYVIKGGENQKRWLSLIQDMLNGGSEKEIARSGILISRDGRELVIEENTSPIRDKNGKVMGLVVVFRDISEKQKIEEEVHKIQRLESLGILAGGIAHDFNNILTAILGNISLARIRSKDNEETLSLLEEAEKASWRARELTQQLLTFSKGGAPVKKTQDIKELIKATTLFSIHGSNVRAKFRFAEDLASLQVDVGQFNQVIQNLVINAREAMPQGGTIEISAENILLERKNSEDFIKEEIDLKPGKYVKIEIHDEGVGIDQKNIQKIFDPYFTTKEHGSGLGLAISYSIINKHNGYIDVDSEKGKGTTFYLFLPVIEQDEKIEINKTNRVHNKNIRILIMDDEDSLRRLMENIVDCLGYSSQLSSDGEEAVKFYQEAMRINNPFTLVFMDIAIPGKMDGLEAMKEILKMDANARVIVTSGADVDEEEYKSKGFSGVLRKPFTMNEVDQIIKLYIE